MFNDVAFYTKRRGFGGAGGVTPTPSRNLTITPSLSNNAERVTWTITSNMTSGVTLDYQFTGANSTTFVESVVSGSIVLDSNGSATITRNLDKFNDYANTSNLAVNINFYAPGSGVLLGKANSNVIVGPANTFTATGGNITSFTGGVDNLPGEYTLHTFPFPSNTSLSVTNVGEYPANTQISVVLVGAGGNGGNAKWNNTNTNLTPAEIAAKLMGSYIAYAGGGGGGGNVIQTNITAQGFTTSNYPVVVSGTTGLSYFAAPTGNLIATPGISGQSGTGTGNADGGNSAVRGGSDSYRTWNSDRFNWLEVQGGGGAGPGGVGGNATVSTGVGSGQTDGYGGAGGAGVPIRITGSIQNVAGGGGGGSTNPVNSPAAGGLGGGGQGAIGNQNATAGSAPGAGGGGGGGGYYTISGSIKLAISYFTNTNDFINDRTYQQGAAGSPGIAYIRYLSKYRRLRIES